jgi:hypothetical protein
MALAQAYWSAIHVLAQTLQHMLAQQSSKSGTDSNGLKTSQVLHNLLIL